MTIRQKGYSKVWLLAGVLMLVAGIIMFLGDDFPPVGDEAAGTIVPAERYRADQIDDEDVALGDQSIALFMHGRLTLARNPFVDGHRRQQACRERNPRSCRLKSRKHGAQGKCRPRCSPVQNRP